MAETSSQRSRTVRYALWLDGRFAGYPQTVEGGALRGELQPSLGGPNDNFQAHVLGRPAVEDLKLGLGFPLERPVHEWLDRSLRNAPPLVNTAALIAFGASGHALRRWELSEPTLVELAFPGMDASARGTTPMRIRMAVRSARLHTEARKDESAVPPGTSVATQSRLDLDEAPVEGVIQMDPVIIRRAAGGRPGTWTLPTLDLTVTEAFAADWIRWHEDTVINGRTRWRQGAWVLASADRRREHLRLRLPDLGISQVGWDPFSAQTESPLRLRVGLYCRSLECVLPPASGGLKPFPRSPTARPNANG